MSDAFSPNRGTQEQILKAAIKNGNVYFSKDTNQIFCDIEDVRHTMSNDGIRFIRGIAEADQIEIDSLEGTYTIPISRTTIDYTLTPYPSFQAGMVIVNIPDSTFYEIKEVTSEKLICEKLLVSGSGGGGDSSSDLVFSPIGNGFVNSYRSGQDITETFRVRDPKGQLKTVDYTVEYSEAEGSIVTHTDVYSGAPVGSNFDITLKSEYLRIGTGKNFIKIIIKSNDGRSTFLQYGSFTVFNVIFAPTSSWEVALNSIVNKSEDFSFIFPFSVTGTAVPENITITREYIFDNGAFTSYFGDTSSAISQTGSSFSDNLQKEILNHDLAHGGHTVEIVARLALVDKANAPYDDKTSNDWVILFDKIYSFGLYQNDEAHQNIPVIWANNLSGNTIKNYDTIKIEYKVYDAANTEKTTVEMYSNNELVRTDSFNYQSGEWSQWNILNYNVDALNIFRITCGTAYKDIEVYVESNNAMSLDPISNDCVLYLSAAGRSNKEIASNRSQWPNKGIAAGNYAGEVQLKNFNWATNGWINLQDLDSSAEDTQVLRVNNGAEVHIPLTGILSNTSLGSTTFEFDFKVRNAVDYSKLITYNTIVNDDGTETVQKTIASDGKGAFLTYYANYKGIMIGTQEAFFSLSEQQVVNARYTEDERVKISFAIDPNGTEVGGNFSLIYIYVNSVLTGVYPYSKSLEFNGKMDEIVINSNYCDVDLYNIRVYNSFLNFLNITQNWVGDASGLTEKINRYNKNQVITQTTSSIPALDYSATKNSGLIPIMILKTYNNESLKLEGGENFDDQLPYSKQVSKIVDVRYYDPNNLDKNFHAQNVICKVQGTSSEGYPRRNFKIQLKEEKNSLLAEKAGRPFKLEKWSGLDTEADVYYDEEAYQITDRLTYNPSKKKGYYNIFDNISGGNQESTFCLKADFMDSSSTHNTCLANLVQELSQGTNYSKGYEVKHPLIKDFGIDSSSYGYLRTTVYGLPIVLFHEDSNGNYTYVGKYNFNLDKSDTDTFGFTNGEQNPYTESKDGISISLPYKAKMCVRLDELTQATQESDGTVSCAYLWQNTEAKALAEYQAGQSKGYVSAAPASGHKIVKPLKWKNSQILSPSESGARAMDSFAATFDAGVYAWKYSTATSSWSIYKVSTAVPTTGDIQVIGDALESGITVATEDRIVDGTQYYISSKYGIEFETYKAASLTDDSTFYLAITDEITYPYVYTQGTYSEPQTFETISECWEFLDNQAGMGKFQYLDQTTDLLSSDEYLNNVDNIFYATVPTGEDGAGRYKASKCFEARYSQIEESDWGNIADQYDSRSSEISTINEEAKTNGFYNNLARVWAWTASTDTEKASNKALSETKYLLSLAPSTREKSYFDSTVESTDYYYYADSIYNKIDPVADKVTVADFSSTSTQGMSFIDNGQTTFVAKISSLSDVTIEATHQISYVFSTKKWYFNKNIEITDLTEYGLAIAAEPTTDISVDITVNSQYKTLQDTSVILYEAFTNDTSRYRLCKFKDEFEEHWDKAYCLFYFVLTEFLLMYDSRQKNMMIASFGPRTFKVNTENIITPGEYIWYPIFYDMDTQLGINNSGQVYWDYDVDATPTDNSSDSIFSGNGSVLWSNFVTCFYPEIQKMYRELRAGSFNYNVLTKYYDTNGSDRWTETMKNVDAYYKYLMPAFLKNNDTAISGFVDTNGNPATVGNKYFYCLQGDRKLNRDAFLRNRFNYLDSQWLARSYEANVVSTSQVKMRYNLNDKGNTSAAIDGLKSTAVFKIQPYLSQYVSVIYDKNATTPQRYKLGENTEAITVDPPSNIAAAQNGNSALSQQLAYIRGSEYLSDIGDLSLKYLNELDCSSAKRLRRLILGNENSSYKNDLITSADLVIGGEATNVNAKGLLNTIDLSNIAGLTSSIELDGCLKLTTFKALGTNLPYIKFPEGNVLTRVYLPNTLNQLELLQPLVLTKLITDASLATDSKDDNEGLYIQDLTDKLDNVEDTGLTCCINQIRITKDKLGFESYRLFKFLYDLKNHIAKGDISYNNSTKAQKFLSIDLEDVNWSEYTQVDSGITYTRIKNNIADYYIKTGFGTYQNITDSEEVWNQEMIDSNIYYKNTSLVNRPNTPIDFIQQICVDYDDASVTKDDFIFKSIYTNDIDASQKMMPIITGRIHINNTEDTSINEYDIANIYNAANHFPELEITANYVTECNRVTFVEYNEDTGAKTILYCQRSNSNEKINYGGKTPSRNHRDFQGWLEVVDDSITPAASQITAKNAREVGSVLTEEAFKNVTVFTTDEINSKELDSTITYVAIYTVHTYTMTFMKADGVSVFTTIDVPSGDYLYAPTARPYKDIENTIENRYKCYRFVGWTNGQASQIAIDLSKIFAQQDMILYPIFEEDSVYNNPLTVDEMIYEWDATNGGWLVGINTEILGEAKKICFPNILTDTTKTHKDGKVIGILKGRGDTSESVSYNGIAYNQNITHIFFQGMDVTDSTRTCYLKYINDYAFCGDYLLSTKSVLAYVDLPSTLIYIGERSFAYQDLTDMSNGLINLQGKTFSKNQIFDQVHQKSYANGDTLIIPGTTFFGSDSFQQNGWNSFQIGTQDIPLNGDTYDKYAGITSLWTAYRVGSTYYPKSIKIYCSSTISQDITTIKGVFYKLMYNAATYYGSTDFIEVVMV